MHAAPKQMMAERNKVYAKVNAFASANIR
eukprot:COSAG06_NODE_46389_length_347_cov_0.838710_1_plen_28_part_10